jgi:hypothetical protein
MSRDRHIAVSASAQARSSGVTTSGPRRSRTNTTDPGPAAEPDDHPVGQTGRVVDRHDDGRLVAVAVDEQEPQGAVAQGGTDEVADAAEDVVIGEQGFGDGGRGR